MIVNSFKNNIFPPYLKKSDFEVENEDEDENEDDDKDDDDYDYEFYTPKETPRNIKPD